MRNSGPGSEPGRSPPGARTTRISSTYRGSTRPADDETRREQRSIPQPSR